MISIIIPTLNEEKYLPRLLESIKQQDFFDYEIIVSDGGSLDKTHSIAHSYSAKLIINDKIKCPSAQRNNGAKAARGEVLLFLDADSVLPVNFLKLAYEEFKKYGLVAASFYIKFNPEKFHYKLYSFISNLIFLLKQKTKNPAGIGAGLMANKSVHDKISGFDLNVLLAEDYDYCARMVKYGKFRIIKSCRLLYSARRLEKEGFWLAGWKWLKMGWFTLTNRKIKKQIVKYDFGKF